MKFFSLFLSSSYLSHVIQTQCNGSECWREDVAVKKCQEIRKCLKNFYPLLIQMQRNLFHQIETYLSRLKKAELPFDFMQLLIESFIKERRDFNSDYSLILLQSWNFSLNESLQLLEEIGTISRNATNLFEVELRETSITYGLNPNDVIDYFLK